MNRSIRWIRTLFLPALALAAFTFAALDVMKAQSKPPMATPPGTPATTPYSDSVAGAGIAEARTENIAVGAHVGGVVDKVNVKVGQIVQAGDVLYCVDARQLQCMLDVRTAALASAEADLHRLEQMPRPEELPVSDAKVREAKANLAAQDDLRKRAAMLVEKNAISREEFVSREQAWQVAAQQLARLQAEDKLLRAGTWEPEKAVARAAVDRAKAEVEQARIDVARLKVQAPVAGEVLQVNVRPGEYVSTPHSMAPIVLGDLRTVNIRVDIDEHDIPRFRPGMPAKATVRGNPGREYELTFVRVEPYVIPKKSLTGDSSERVDTRVLQVIYALKPGEQSVYVGQQMDVFIDVSPDQHPTASKI